MGEFREKDGSGGDAYLGEILEADGGDADDGEEVGRGEKQPRHHHLPRPRGPQRSAEGKGRGWWSQRNVASCRRAFRERASPGRGGLLCLMTASEPARQKTPWDVKRTNRRYKYRQRVFGRLFSKGPICPEKFSRF